MASGLWSGRRKQTYESPKQRKAIFWVIRYIQIRANIPSPVIGISSVIDPSFNVQEGDLCEGFGKN